ncbi:MAG: hypothetical protein HWN66_02125 [Candidatus Helarchaeota archaeon]|nr:hypothetical protein [Candidatus Helarchaeota archaeon]
MGYKLVGNGFSVSTKKEVEGVFIVIKTVQDVIELIQGEAEGKICYTEQAGTTTLAPILGRISGVICKTGTFGSHLAIVSREYEIPAFMATKIEYDLSELNGKKVKMHTVENGNRGELYLIE